MIEAIAAHHPGRIDLSTCVVQDTVTWTKGQFNTCILVHVRESDGSVSKKIFRCPLAHKVGERFSPGAVDEKMRAEAGAYAWIEEHCPEIPVPKLHGFGFFPELQVEQLIFANKADYLTHLHLVYTPGARHRFHSRPFQHQI